MKLTLSNAVKSLQSHETLVALGLTLPEQKNAPQGKPDPFPVVCKPKVRAMTKTEARYVQEVLTPAGIVAAFEAVVFNLRNGHRYTPDFSYFRADRVHFVEVKGAHRLGSYQRARMAFDQAAIEHPYFVWIWAEYRGGVWHTEAV